MARVPETKQESEHLSLSCLGWPRLHITGRQEIRLPSSRKAIALLLYLFHHPTVHARSTIACLLWSEVTESERLAAKGASFREHPKNRSLSFLLQPQDLL